MEALQSFLDNSDLYGHWLTTTFPEKVWRWRSFDRLWSYSPPHDPTSRKDCSGIEVPGNILINNAQFKLSNHSSSPDGSLSVTYKRANPLSNCKPLQYAEFGIRTLVAAVPFSLSVITGVAIKSLHLLGLTLKNRASF